MASEHEFGDCGYSDKYMYMIQRSFAWAHGHVMVIFRDVNHPDVGEKSIMGLFSPEICVEC